MENPEEIEQKTLSPSTICVECVWLTCTCESTSKQMFPKTSRRKNILIHYNFNVHCKTNIGSKIQYVSSPRFKIILPVQSLKRLFRKFFALALGDIFHWVYSSWFYFIKRKALQVCVDLSIILCSLAIIACLFCWLYPFFFLQFITMSTFDVFLFYSRLRLRFSLEIGTKNIPDS